MSEPVAQPIPSQQPEPVGEPIGDEFKPWKSITVALEGWEYAIWQKWLGTDVMEQDKRAKLILDALQNYDPQATMTFSESRSMRTEGRDEVFRFRFSLYGEPDEVSQALLSIYSTVLGMVENYKVYAGKAYAILEYEDGDKRMVKANITKNADLDDAFESVMEQTYTTMGAKYEEDQLQVDSAFKFFQHWKEQLDEIEETLTKQGVTKEELDKAANMMGDLFADIGEVSHDIMAGGDEFATDEELEQGKYDEYKAIVQRANKIERSNLWKQRFAEIGEDIPSWEEKFGHCAHCGQEIEGLQYVSTETSDDEIADAIQTHYTKFHPGVEAFKKEEEVARDSWLDYQKQRNVQMPDGGLQNTKPWAVSPFYKVPHLEWRLPLTTSDGKTTEVRAPTNTMTPDHYGVPLITPITPSPSTKGGEQGHYSRTPSPQQSMPDIEYASIEWCDIHNKTMKEHDIAELDLDIQTLKATGVPFLNEETPPFLSEEAQTQRLQVYQLTPDEVDKITEHVWKTSCNDCFRVLQTMKIDEQGNYSIDTGTLDSFPQAKQHFAEVMGYGGGEIAQPETPALDPEDPKFRQIVEWTQERPSGQFGRFTGLPKDVPTLNEWGISEYLRALGVRHELHYPIGSILPEYGKKRIEFDIWIPDLVMAIEVNPAWHKGGASEIPRVAELDALKEQIAKENGINLVTIDPGTTFSKFASELDTKLVPELRAGGVDAPLLAGGEGGHEEEGWVSEFRKVMEEEMPVDTTVDELPDGRKIEITKWHCGCVSYIDLSLPKDDPNRVSLDQCAQCSREERAEIEEYAQDTEPEDPLAGLSPEEIAELERQSDEAERLSKEWEKEIAERGGLDYTDPQKEEEFPYSCPVCGKDMAFATYQDWIDEAEKHQKEPKSREGGNISPYQEEDKVGEIAEHPNEWRYRLVEPKEFDDFRYGKDELGDGVSVIWGFKGKGKDRKSDVQAIRFAKRVFKSKDDVQAWLKAHKDAVEKIKKGEQIPLMPSKPYDHYGSDPELPRTTNENLDEEIEYLQWQIGNLDTALEQLDNATSRRLIDLEN